MKNKTTILVTGAAGYIGSAAVRLLCDRGYVVVALDNLEKGEKKYVDKRAIFAQCDVTDEKKLDGVFKKYRPNVVIHLAAKKSVSESEAEPLAYYNNNVKGSIHIVLLSQQYQVKKIIFASTAAVYGSSLSGVYTEESKVSPASVYGSTKLMVEEVLQKVSLTSDLETVILRFFNVVGDVGFSYKEKAAQNVFPKIAQAIHSGTPITIFGKDWETSDGTGVRDYIHLHDLCRALVKSVEKNVQGVFNLGTSTGTSVLEIVKEFENVLGRKVNFVYKKRRNGDVAVCLADSHKAYKKLSWKPEKSVRHAVLDTVRVYELE